MTLQPRSVSSHPARHPVSLSGRLVLQTLLRHLARIEDSLLAYCARRRTRRGPDRMPALVPSGSAAQETAAPSTPRQPRRKPAPGILFARTLAIVLVLVTIGLARGHQAFAQGASITTARAVALANLADDEITDICNRKFIQNSHAWNVCVSTLFAERDDASKLVMLIGSGSGQGQALPSRLAGRSRAEASESSASNSDPTFAPTLESNVSTLPFLGNWLTVLSWVPNAASESDATVAYAVGLARQSDCSLDENYILPGAGLPDAEYLTSLTEAQDYFHQLAGLTTTPDVFANGCTPQVLGLPATGLGLSLGSTSDGAGIGAELASNGMYVTVTDLTANTTTNTQLTSGQNPGYFSAASLRGNGIMDLVETGLTDPVTSAPATAVLLGNGDGTFKPAVYYDVADTSGTPGGFVIDDVNGDGIPDIVVLKSTSITNTGVATYTGTVTTLIGKGDGTFTVGPVSNATWTDSLLPVTGVFKTGDQKDLLIGGTVLFGAGDGSFTQGPTNAAIASATNYLFPGAVGSLRNNGKLDVVVTQAGFVSIYYGNGDGTFITGPSYAALPDYMQVTITDIDGDGNPDIVLGTSSGGVYTEGGYDTPLPMFQILMGRGDGTFVDSPVYNQGTYGDPGNPNNSGLEIASGKFVSGSSNLDVLAFGQSNNGGTASSLLMLPGNGTGALGAPVTSSINIAPTFLVAAKMNHDTLPDAVLAGYSLSASPQLSVLVNQGNGTFAGEQDYTLPNDPVSLAVGDFNGDGIPDVAVGISGMGVYVLLGQSNGTLGTPVQIDSSMNPTGLAAGSLTTDGRTDLVVADQGYFSYVGSGQQINGALHVYLGNANGTFTTVTAPTTTATNYSVAALGDLNNDGKLDLIVAGNVAGTSAGTGTPNVYTLLGNGDGTFQAANTLALAGTDGIGATSIALADVNKDGDLDVVVGNPNDLTEVLFGNGNGTLIDTALALGQRPATVAAADLLGNGYPEILVGEASTQGQGDSLTVFQNQSTAWATAATTTTPTVTVTPSPASITTAQSTMVTVTVSGGGATPTGSVTLTSGTYTSAATTLTSGSAVITVPGSSLAVTTDTLTATYTPDSNSSSTYNSAIGINTVTVTAATTPTFALSNGGNIDVEASVITGNTSTITVTPANGFTGAVALTCAVTTTPANPTSPATCGVTPSVTISGTTAQNATVTVTTTATTTAGAYAVTVYGMSGSITQMTTVDITVTAYVPPPTFALSNSGNITVSPGATTGNTSTIAVTPSNGFAGAVALTCAISPVATSDPASCTLASPSVTISGATAQSSALTVTTTAATTSTLVRPALRGTLLYAAGGATLACLLFFGIPARRRRWRSVLGMIVLLALLAGGIASCGGKSSGGGSGNPGTTAGTYTITVTGASGSIMQTTTVTLTVN